MPSSSISRWALLLLAAGALPAQPPVAPSPVPTVPATEQGPYRWTNSVELGYRFRTITGDEGTYRSQVNYGNGLRLLSGRLTADARDGRGVLFDKLTVDTLGLGNDPYQAATVHLDKTRWYSYDGLWRSNDYFNPALPIAGGRHAIDTTHRWQDHTLTLLPQRRFRLLVGYGRNAQSGPALTTRNLQGPGGDEWTLFSTLQRRQQNVRLGTEFTVLGTTIHLLRGWDWYREDAPATGPADPAGENGLDRNTLTSYGRTEPFRGTAPYWRVSLFRGDPRRYAVSGRWTHVNGQRDFTQREAALGTARFGSFDRQIVVFGRGRRPLTTGGFTLTWLPGERWTVTNHSAYANTRWEGNNTFRELANGSLEFEQVNFELLGIRLLVNETDAQYRWRSWLLAHAGYAVSQRRILSQEQATSFDVPEREVARQSNTVHSGTAGVRVKPLKRLTLVGDVEIGRASQPFYPTSEGDFHLWRVRAEYRTRSLLVAGLGRTDVNQNAAALTAFQSRSRRWGAEAAWTHRSGLTVDASYALLRLATEGGIRYFRQRELVSGERSRYLSHLHTLSAGVRVPLRQWAEVYAGYTRVEDTASAGRSGYTSLPVLLGAQAYPLTYESPAARWTVHLRKGLNWNVGYQHYRFSERYTGLQRYHAHTGYTSLAVSF